MSKTFKLKRKSTPSNSQGGGSKSNEEFSDERDVNDLKICMSFNLQIQEELKNLEDKDKQLTESKWQA